MTKQEKDCTCVCMLCCQLKINFYAKISTPLLARCTVVTMVPGVPVEVSEWQNVVTAGGCVMRGLHATVAPRRAAQHREPVLERFCFVPYEQECPLPPDGREYAQTVVDFAVAGMKTLISSRNGNVHPPVQSFIKDIRTSRLGDKVAHYLSEDGQNGLIKVCFLCVVRLNVWRLRLCFFVWALEDVCKGEHCVKQCLLQGLPICVFFW